ncbi:monofunctional biosynthetic peptidoglycan transglycosylase [Citreimonas salinaria]|uniref:Biosynthetic peptidoglycan transglycosylase n=1 Tax=Citreimonas salinaria TaxID=321339 RepID=A0A1H3HU93_9RHOB|nr:monofunctional biosynthetic peptidoglycan transglycosylase [Citreimonas salinaria]SDY18990.1 monofunctional biosynthetic peptidoglycan transglycosylase [Citreimonas salinaria]
MAKKQTGTSKRDKAARARRRAPLRWLRRQALRAVLAVAALALLLVLVFRFVAPPTTHTMWVESRRLGGVERDWVPVDRIAPVMLRSAVAAEDANFCAHWGFDMNAIRDAIADGAARGGSTISQQVVKNVFLWQGRSWPRKALEAGLTPLVEAFWPKRRILEVYLNVAEFDEGVFGVEAAALHYFGVAAADLSDAEAARLAAILPAPKSRSAVDPTAATRRRAAQIADGAVVIARDGRAACFEAE